MTIVHTVLFIYTGAYIFGFKPEGVGIQMEIYMTVRFLHKINKVKQFRGSGWPKLLVDATVHGKLGRHSREDMRLSKKGENNNIGALFVLSYMTITPSCLFFWGSSIPSRPLVLLIL